MKGRPEKIDILGLYANSTSAHWNEFLTHCLKRKDLVLLEKTLYGIQLGMTDASENGLASDKVVHFFLRLQRSIENTIKMVIKLKKPHPLDNPLNIATHGHLVSSKRERDLSIERYLKRIRF